ncbi:MAG: hypothetical protein P3B98_01670 [Gemmatimonadota bacterium]|nr:hypothetical protein [Gemmatimonadota bacterium]
MNRTRLVTLLRRIALLAVLVGFAAVPVLMALQTAPVARSGGGC